MARQAQHAAKPISSVGVIGFVLLALILTGIFVWKRTDNAEVWTTQGQLHFDKKEYEQAISAYQQALQRNPPQGPYNVPGSADNLKWRIAVNYDYLAALRGTEGRWDEARRLYDQALSSWPDDPTAQRAIQQMMAFNRTNAIASSHAAVQTAQPDQDVRILYQSIGVDDAGLNSYIQMLATAGVPDNQQNRVLTQAAYLSSNGHEPVDQVLNVIVIAMQRRQSVSKALEIAQTIGHYQAMYPAANLFQFAIDISGSPNPQGAINGLRAALIGLSGKDDSLDLQVALLTLAH